MKKFLFTFYFLLFTLNIFSQVNKLYDFGTNTICSDMAKLPNGNYIFITEANYDTTRLTIINENGEIQEQIKLNYYNSLSRNSIEIFNNKIYTLLMDVEDFVDTTKYFLSFTCYNLNFDTIWNKKYFVDTTLVYSRNFIPTNDSGFALVGSIDKGGYEFDGLLIKTDSLGELQWYKEYGYVRDEEFYNIIQTQDSCYIFSGFSEKYNTSNWYIVRTDSLGNQIWDWVLHNPLNLNDGAISDLIQTQDGNFVAVGGQTYETYPHILQNARLLKFDINKNILLDTLFYEKYEDEGIEDTTKSNFVKIKQLTNSNFLVIGYSQAISGNFWTLTSNLYIMDNNFSIISKRNYKSLPYGWGAEYIKDFIVEPDGSLAMIGDINSNGATSPIQQVWFVKTDANYCDGFGSCDTLKGIDFLISDTISKTDTINFAFKINSNFNIDHDVRFIFYSTNKYSHFLDTVIYNIPANSIDSSFELSYNLIMENGYPTEGNDTIYIFYSLYPSDSISCGKFNSHISDNYVVFVEPTGIIELQKTETSLRVYPNPAKNNVQITMSNLQLSKNTSVFIYDVFGKIVRVIAIPINREKQSVQTDSHEQSSRYDVLTINIADLEKGVYFVRVGSAVGKFVKE